MTYSCRICGTALEPFMSFGEMPIANGFLTPEEFKSEYFFELKPGSKLMVRNQLGKEFFSRGIPENLEKKRTINYTLSLLDLMQGYARIRTRDDFRPFSADRENVFTIETALGRMQKMLGFSEEWNDLMRNIATKTQDTRTNKAQGCTLI